ncbi:MAG: hypothetical protein CV089_00740 [Nitrospira sp. WS110]|nr:hypothetical protein [Nitrospira sp. WS110]
MIQFTRSRYLLSLAKCAVLLYILMLGIGTGCMLAHADHAQHHHHSESSSSPQKTFCDWLCQTTAETTVANGAPLVATELMLGSVDHSLPQLVSSVGTYSHHTRAPPSFSLRKLV